MPGSMALSNGARGRAGGGGCTTRQKPFQRPSSAGRLRPISSPSRARDVSPSVGRTVQAGLDLRPDVGLNTDSSFSTTDVCKINAERHNCQRMDTFHTPSRLRDSDYTDPFRQDIHDAVREELHEGIKWLREDMFQGCRDAMSMATADIKEEILTLRGRLDADFSLVLGEMRKLHPGKADLGGDKADRSLADTSPAATDFRREAPIGRTFEELRRLLIEAMASIAGCRNQLDLQLQEVRGITPQFSEVLTAIEKFRSQVDLQPLIDEFKRAQTHAPQRKAAAVDLQPLLEELREFKAGMDFAPILGSIEMTKAELNWTLQPILEEIRRIRVIEDSLPLIDKRITGAGSKVEVDHSRLAVEEMIRSIQRGIDRDSMVEIEHRQHVVEEIRSIKHEFEAIKAQCVRTIENSTMSVEEIRKIMTEIDFSPVLAAIQEKSAGSGSTAEENQRPLVEKIRRVMTEIDFSPVLAAIQEKSAGSDSKVERDHRQHVVEEIRSIKHEFEAIKAQCVRAIENSTMSVEEIRKVMTEIDFSPVLAAIQEKSAGSDSKVERDHRHSVVEEIRSIKSEIDFSPVLMAIRSLKVEVNYHPLVEEIRRIMTELVYARLPPINHCSSPVSSPVLPRSPGQASCSSKSGSYLYTKQSISGSPNLPSKD